MKVIFINILKILISENEIKYFNYNGLVINLILFNIKNLKFVILYLAELQGKSNKI